MLSSTNSKIYFFHEVPVYLKNRTKLKRFLASLIKKENHEPGSINYIFCSDKRLLDINRQYLNHDFYTDIITFEMSGKGQPLVADIFISVERVRQNAQELGFTFTYELHRVMFHGLLHLCGYRDKTPKQTAEMRKAEDGYLKNYLS